MSSSTAWSRASTASDDRRVVECTLTDQGRQLIEEIGGMRREMLRHTLGVLSEEELAD